MKAKSREYIALKKALDRRPFEWWVDKYLPRMKYQTVMAQLYGNIKTMSKDVRDAANEFVDSQKENQQ